MKKILYVTLLLAPGTAVLGRQADPAVIAGVAMPSVPIEDTPVVPDRMITCIEEMPQFPGGTPALRKYIQDNLRYPKAAKENELQGKVIVRFTVDEGGRIVNVFVARGIGSRCDEEALRLVKNMPKWTPGKQNGRPVKVFYTLPVSFTLQD